MLASATGSSAEPSHDPQYETCSVGFALARIIVLNSTHVMNQFKQDLFALILMIGTSMVFAADPPPAGAARRPGRVPSGLAIGENKATPAERIKVAEAKADSGIGI